MTKHIPAAQLVQLAQIHESPRQSTVVDRSFELPTALYALTVGCYLAFLAVMAAAFGTSELAIPMAIFIVYIVMAFGVPAMWTQIGSDTKGSRRLSWLTFRSQGISTLYGQVSAGSAAAQVLVLPLAILGWGIAIALIAALV